MSFDTYLEESLTLVPQLGCRPGSSLVEIASAYALSCPVKARDIAKVAATDHVAFRITILLKLYALHRFPNDLRTIRRLLNTQEGRRSVDNVQECLAEWAGMSKEYFRRRHFDPCLYQGDGWLLRLYREQEKELRESLNVSSDQIFASICDQAEFKDTALRRATKAAAGKETYLTYLRPFALRRHVRAGRLAEAEECLNLIREPSARIDALCTVANLVEYRSLT